MDIKEKAASKPKKKWVRYLLLASGLVFGLVLIFVGSGRSTAGTEKAADDSAAMRDYAAETEEKVRKLCESVEGVGRGTVTVAVTLECGYETVYAEDSEKKTSQSGETVSGKYTKTGSGSSERPIKMVTRAPVIAGIGVVCRGGGNDASRADTAHLGCLRRRGGKDQRCRGKLRKKRVCGRQIDGSFCLIRRKRNKPRRAAIYIYRTKRLIGGHRNEI